MNSLVSELDGKFHQCRHVQQKVLEKILLVLPAVVCGSSRHLVEEGVVEEDCVVDPSLPIHQSDSSASGPVVEVVDVEAIVSSAGMAGAYSGLMAVLCASFWDPPERVALTLAHCLEDFALRDNEWVNSRLEVVYPAGEATSCRWTIGGNRFWWARCSCPLLQNHPVAS